MNIFTKVGWTVALTLLLPFVAYFRGLCAMGLMFVDAGKRWWADMRAIWQR